MDPMTLMTEILRDKFNVRKPLGPETDVNDIGLDSLDVINFLYSLEEQTGVPVPDEDIERYKLRTLASFAAYVTEHAATKAGS